MKLTSIVGSGSGRLGGSVFAVRHGEQIVRTLQKKVHNPKSEAQTEQRAKMKAAVQLSAIMSQALAAFKGFGGPNVSARNAFVSDLFKRGAVTFDTTNNAAVINRGAIRISPSAIAWRISSTVAAGTGGAGVSGVVTVDREFVQDGTVLTAGVLHNENTGSTLLLGLTSFAVNAEEVQITLPIQEPVANGDTIVMMLSVPREADMARRYRSLMWDYQSSTYRLAVVSTVYASAFDHLMSYNNAITLTGREVQTETKTKK